MVMWKSFQGYPLLTRSLHQMTSQTNHHYNNANAVARPTTSVMQIPYIMDGFTGLCFCQHHPEQLQSVFHFCFDGNWLADFQNIPESHWIKLIQRHDTLNSRWILEQLHVLPQIQILLMVKVSKYHTEIALGAGFAEVSTCWDFQPWLRSSFII